jgi:hypothetical protein
MSRSMWTGRRPNWRTTARRGPWCMRATIGGASAGVVGGSPTGSASGRTAWAEVRFPQMRAAAQPAPRIGPMALWLAGRWGELQLRPVPSWRAHPQANWASSSSTALPTPVTIRKDESAMLPFLQQPIEARKLLIYSDHSSRASHQRRRADQLHRQDPGWRPHHGLRRPKATAAKRSWRRLKAGDKRLISYAVDLGTRITEAFGTTGGGARNPRRARRPDHQTGRGRDPNLYRPQRGQERPRR